MTSKRTYRSPRDRQKRPPKVVYNPCRSYVESLSMSSGTVEICKATFSKGGRLRGGSITFRVLTGTPAALTVSLPDGRSWVEPVKQGKNVLWFECVVKKGTDLVFKLTGEHEVLDAYIHYEFAEGAE